MLILEFQLEVLLCKFVVYLKTRLHRLGFKTSGVGCGMLEFPLVHQFKISPWLTAAYMKFIILALFLVTNVPVTSVDGNIIGNFRRESKVK